MIYAAADLHLCRFVWRSRKDMEGDAFAALRSFAKAVVNDKVPEGEDKNVVLAGDIFDTKKVDGATLEAFCWFVDYLWSNDIQVFFIEGNHEKVPGSVAIAETCGATPIKNSAGAGWEGKDAPEELGIVCLDGRLVAGVNFCNRERLLEIMEFITNCGKDIDILVLHCAMEHLVGYVGACDLKLEEIPKNVQNIFVGDIHVRHEQPLPGRGYCVSPGPLHPCNIAQGGPKGFYKLPSGSRDWEAVDVEYREIYRFQVETAGDWTESLKLLKAHKSTGMLPIVEIKYASEVTDVVEAWMKINAGKTCIIFDTTIPDPIELELPEAAQKQDLSLTTVMPYLIKNRKALELAEALANTPESAERIVDNKIEEMLKDDNPEEAGVA